MIRASDFLTVAVFVLCIWGGVCFGVDPANPPESMRVEVDKDGQTLTLYLERYSIRGADFELVLLGVDGTTQTTIDAGPVRTYRGWCEEEPDSIVAAMLLENGDLRYHVFKGNADDWWHIPQVEYNENAGAENNFTEIGGTPNQPAGEVYAGASFTESAATLDSFYRDTYQADVGFDLTVEYVDNFNYSDWVTYGRKAESAISRYNAITTRDMFAEHTLGKVVIRQSQAGLDYTHPQWDLNWPLINTYWEELFPSVDHHFLAFVGSVGGGVAYVCDYGGTNWGARSFNGWSSDGTWWHVWRHEAGHNWGCGDCVEGCPGPDGSTVNSGNSLTLSRFSNPEITQFMNCRRRSDKYTILRNIGTYTYPVPPYANLDRATMDVATEDYVDIDVVGNDYDANGDQIAISEFDETSDKGGTVMLGAGEGPDGRDILIYVPPGNVLGEDRFHYTIVDETGRTSEGNIIIYLDLSSTLKGHWRLDETSGTMANDSSVFSRNGSLRSGTSDWSFDNDSAAGQFDGALDFGGDPSDDYIEVSGLNFSSNTVTITAWVKRNGNQNDYTGIVSNRNSGAQNLNFLGTTNRLGYHWNDSQYWWNSGLMVPDNEWTFVALVIEPTRATIYMDDGTLNSAVNMVSHDAGSFYGSTSIGRDASGGSRYFKGAIDDVRIYDFAMSQAQIEEVISGGAAESPNPFDGAEGVDSSVLGWSAGSAAIEHDIYIGEDYGSVAAATKASAEYRTTQAANTYQANLVPLTQYFWRVDTVTTNGTVTGDVWSFTTGAGLISLNDNLTVHYTLDADDISGGTVYDDSGEPIYDGTIYGASAYSAGQIEEGLSFDGSNDYVSIPEMNLNSNTVTMSAWVKRNGNQNAFSGIVICVSSITKAGFNFYYDNKLGYHWAGGYWGWDSGLVVPDNEWVHVAMVVEPDKGTLYVNGVSATSSGTHEVEEFDNITRIGNYDGWYGRYFNGAIDDVAIWNRSLSEAEILTIYQKGLAGDSFSNKSPAFASSIFSGSDAVEAYSYSDSIAGQASDPDPEDTVIYSKAGGGNWLRVESDGSLSGIPGDKDVGLNEFVVRAEDAHGGYDEATLQINVANTYSGEIGLADFSEFASRWLEMSCGYCDGADLTGEGDVGFDDLLVFADYWIGYLGPEGWWNFDEGTGLAVSDSSGNGLDGVLVNMDESAWADGYTSGALEFDGADDFVQIVGYKGISGPSERTCAAWVKPSVSTDTRSVVSWGYQEISQKWVFCLSDTDFGVRVQGGNIFCDGSAVFDGQWHHIAATFGGEGITDISETWLYIDGIEQLISQTKPCTVETGSAYDVTIGQYNNGSYFAGLIDDVRIYDRVLSADEIAELASH